MLSRPNIHLEEVHMSNLEQQPTKNLNTHTSKADYSSDNWEERVADLEEEKQVFEFPRRKGSKIPAGRGNDLISIILGGVFAAGVVGTGWFVFFFNGWFNYPWFAIILAAATLFGVKASSDGTQRMDTGVAVIIYLLALITVLGLITYHSSLAIQNEGFSFALFEDELIRTHFERRSNLFWYLGGLALVAIFGAFSRKPAQYRS